MDFIDCGDNILAARLNIDEIIDAAEKEKEEKDVEDMEEEMPVPTLTLRLFQDACVCSNLMMPVWFS
jgi:hypothetical protein